MVLGYSKVDSVKVSSLLQCHLKQEGEITVCNSPWWVGPGQLSEQTTELANRIYFSFFFFSTAQFKKCLSQWKDSFAHSEEDNCLEDDVVSKENRDRNALVFMSLILVFYVVLEIHASELWNHWHWSWKLKSCPMTVKSPFSGEQAGFKCLLGRSTWSHHLIQYA